MVNILGTPDITPDQVRSSRTKHRRASFHLDPFRRILDLYMSRWFGNEPRKRGKGRDKFIIDDVLDFLRSVESQKWLHDPSGAQLAGHDRDLVETATLAARGRRFFHWELEFPEVFYGPRKEEADSRRGEQAIERLATAGFDAVIGNPPYGEPSTYYGSVSAEEKVFLDNFEPYAPFKNGRTNLYRLFLLRGVALARSDGMLSFIVPMTLLGDEFSRPTREFLVTSNRLMRIEVFPQKDDPRRRVFPEAKLSTCIFVTRRGKGDYKVCVRTHPGRHVLTDSPGYEAARDDLVAALGPHVVVPRVSEAEWLLLQKAFAKPDWPRLSSVAYVYGC